MLGSVNQLKTPLVVIRPIELPSTIREPEGAVRPGRDPFGLSMLGSV